MECTFHPRNTLPPPQSYFQSEKCMMDSVEELVGDGKSKETVQTSRRLTLTVTTIQQIFGTYSNWPTPCTDQYFQ